MRLRVEPMVRFYQNRLPSYYRARYTSVFLLMAGTLSGTVLAFLSVRAPQPCIWATLDSWH